ncbi:MAG: ABC transporter permease subunit [Chloroflexi bacterium]|nr:ABC transporter permease subunit [Chloroflexota bacterium]
MSAALTKVRPSVAPTTILNLVLVGAIALSMVRAGSPAGVLNPEGLSAAGQSLGAAFNPDLAPAHLRLTLAASGRTLAYAAAGMTLAFAGGIPLGVIASGSLGRSSRPLTAVTVACRMVLGLLRAVHELVWALILVFALGLSPLAGGLAIGIPYAGILGRVIADQLRDVPESRLAALRASGASETQVLLYGQIPGALPDLVSYFFYRSECAIRSAAVLSIVGLGGIGYRITVALDDLHYREVWTLVYALVLIVVAVDIWSAQVRRRLT